ncbi:MAG: hypothetical protein FWG63_02225, partial [Defluviitaleaceae bacterium]|nr:hypothetical protein [Defluviitaleaceae bacterium]
LASPYEFKNGLTSPPHKRPRAGVLASPYEFKNGRTTNDTGIQNSVQNSKPTWYTAKNSKQCFLLNVFNHSILIPLRLFTPVTITKAVIIADTQIISNVSSKPIIKPPYYFPMFFDIL